MSRPEAAQARWLDPVSRRVVARFSFSLGWFGMIAFAPALAGLTAEADSLAALGTYCSFGALLRVLTAGYHREKPCAASLNSWDECLALVAAAMLAYAGARMLG